MKGVKQSHAEWPERESWLPLLELSVREVYERMLGCQVEPGIITDTQPTLDCMALVGLTGTLRGVLSLRCSSASAILMASKMLELSAGDADPQMGDAIGEICNMIAGNFKSRIPELSDRCMLSVPTVIAGEDYTCHSLADGGSIDTAFLLEGSPVTVTLQVHS